MKWLSNQVFQFIAILGMGMGVGMGYVMAILDKSGNNIL